MKFEFQKARPVWGENLTRTYNQHLGFRTDVVLEKETEICIVLAARTYYRLYINGKRKAHGPARPVRERGIFVTRSFCTGSLWRS